MKGSIHPQYHHRRSNQAHPTSNSTNIPKNKTSDIQRPPYLPNAENLPPPE
ncbi:unnamed protein product [Periconia digitata]|uniref:Uncharacterized protein n=1 Tax=Periconia digitata TaxID=1303443 RepID=A0A9W4XGQ7_9PLEO|nr:unnamed protein product [Periconia digitata]